MSNRAAFAGRDDQFWILSTSGKSFSFFGKSTIHFVIEIDPCPPLVPSPTLEVKNR